MIARIIEMVRKEFRQVLRDPRSRAVLIGPPIIQLLVFGYAVNLDVERVRTGWMDLDRTPQSREIRAAFAGSPNFAITHEPKDERDVADLLDRGYVDVVISVERGFGADLLRERTAHVQILIDGTNSNTASIISSYVQQIVGRFATEWAERQKQMRLIPASIGARAAVEARMPRLEPRSRVWFNAEMRSRDYYVPGIIALVITVTTMTLTALALVREKEIGTMEQLLVTPLRGFELMLGKTIPFALVGMFDVALVTILALLIFGVPLRGHVALLFLGAAFYLMVTLGLGLFISEISHTQQQAMMMSFLFIQPIIMLSGFAFPIANMPLPVQWLTYLNPMRYFLQIVRVVFLKGVGLQALWPQYVALAVYGVGIFGLISLRFRKRLE
ncbi:ABC transporter permease [Candidatus Sumerlaeota bacterium]|nr:ABC transporter permease [Candidatus Sumerlaeota bacterium]